MTWIVFLVLLVLLVAKEAATREADYRREREMREMRHFYETVLARDRSDSDAARENQLSLQRMERNHLIEQIRDAEARAADERTRLIDRLLAVSTPRALTTLANTRESDQFESIRERLESREPLREYVDPETHEKVIPVGL